MQPAHSSHERRGISLTEVLIGIMILGIGVISLATLFPLGLLQVRRAVNDVRGAIVAQSGWNEMRVRRLIAPPFGPPAVLFTSYPTANDTPPGPWSTRYRPTRGPGVPVMLDPLWMIQNSPTAYLDQFGAFPGVSEGLLRVRGGSLSDIPPRYFSLELASEVFASPDDLTYGSADERSRPLQLPNSRAGSLLYPTYGTPFAPQTLDRERRFTWIAIVRKTNAMQISHPGPNGVPGDPDDIVEDRGPDLSAGTADDPAVDMQTGTPVPAPVGPFEVTVVSFYSRDFGAREPSFANQGTPGPRVFTQGSAIATLYRRGDNIPFPEFPLDAVIMDTSCNTAAGTFGGHVYRVKGRSYDASRNLLLTLDQPAVADGYVLTVLRGAVGVFERQIP